MKEVNENIASDNSQQAEIYKIEECEVGQNCLVKAGCARLFGQTWFRAVVIGFAVLFRRR